MSFSLNLFQKEAYRTSMHSKLHPLTKYQLHTSDQWLLPRFKALYNLVFHTSSFSSHHKIQVSWRDQNLQFLNPCFNSKKYCPFWGPCEWRGCCACIRVQRQSEAWNSVLIWQSVFSFSWPFRSVFCSCRARVRYIRF